MESVHSGAYQFLRNGLRLVRALEYGLIDAGLSDRLCGTMDSFQTGLLCSYYM